MCIEHLDETGVCLMLFRNETMYKIHMGAAGYYLMLGNTEQLNWALEDALYFWMKSYEIH